ncbi:hypothetical protein E2C01_059333 [Portunus trituberculatus]|uniref:Uncharacterized protein n=1 Tax=Portunus trituberculatus TaxID=210409 RepID=A0A5B7H293_PORTR|nr:hypothetical protein [Portunus trituberculatus]
MHFVQGRDTGTPENPPCGDRLARHSVMLRDLPDGVSLVGAVVLELVLLVVVLLVLLVLLGRACVQNLREGDINRMGRRREDEAGTGGGVRCLAKRPVASRATYHYKAKYNVCHWM